MATIIKDVDMCVASNGFIVRYDEWHKDDNDNYSNPSFVKTRKEVFKLTEKDKAMDCLIEYSQKSGQMDKEDSEEESET
jgi:hypothetical protein